ncbi:MAG: helix-turn-helix domain-containing protein [Burkholderiales bacterium]
MTAHQADPAGDGTPAQPGAQPMAPATPPAAPPVTSMPAPPAAAPSPQAALPATNGLVDSLAALVAAREAKGLSADDLARKLNLAPRQVAALEAGDWPALPGHAFVRAALRSYGRLIGVDVMPLLASIGDAAGAPDLRPATSLREPMPRPGLFGFGSGGSGSRLVWIALSVALVVAIAFFFGRVPGLPGSQPAPAAPAGAVAPGPTDAASTTGQTASPAPAAGQPAAPAAPTGAALASPDATAAAPAAATSTTSTAPTVTPASNAAPQSVPGAFPPLVPAPAAPAAPASGAPAPATAAPATPASAAPASAAPSPASAPARPAPAPRSGELRLNFQGESWVEIRRADGQLVHEGVQKRGSALRFPVDTEILVVLGNAQAVQVVHNGGPLDVGPLTRQGVARLKLAP